MQISKLLLLIIILLLSACTPAAAEISMPTAEPTVPMDRGASSSPEPLTGLPPKSVLDAQNWLAERLGVPVEQVEIVDVKQEQWPDTCLGLDQPGEMCAQMITPGWQVKFEVNGQQYEIRTDETASVVRLADG